jgi:anti-anti-sigma regulatory factor
MATVATVQKIDRDRLVEGLNNALAKVEGGESEVLLDFSAVRRISPVALRELDALIAKAEQKSAKVALRGVNIDAYKVLKLARLSGRLEFVN